MAVGLLGRDGLAVVVGGLVGVVGLAVVSGFVYGAFTAAMHLARRRARRLPAGAPVHAVQA